MGKEWPLTSEWVLEVTVLRARARCGTIRLVLSELTPEHRWSKPGTGPGERRCRCSRCRLAPSPCPAGAAGSTFCRLRVFGPEQLFSPSSSGARSLKPRRCPARRPLCGLQGGTVPRRLQLLAVPGVPWPVAAELSLPPSSSASSPASLRVSFTLLRRTSGPTLV